MNHRLISTLARIPMSAETRSHPYGGNHRSSGTTHQRVRTIVGTALVATVAGTAFAGGLAAPESAGGDVQRIASNGHIEPDGPIG